MKQIILKQLKNITPLAFLLLGLLIFCISMITNSSAMPGDLGDARLINYILEHGFLWLKQAPTHEFFWSPPFFWPEKNSLATTDILLGGMIIYSPIRFFCKNPMDTLQIFYILVNILNFIIFYIFIKKIFKFEIFYCSLASFFFSFCLPRYAQIIHLQMFLQFYMILIILFLSLINSKNSPCKNRIFFSLACFLLVFLCYTSIYYAWFLIFGIILFLITTISFKKTKEKIIKYFKNYDSYFLIPALISIFPLVYLFIKYYSQNLNHEFLFYSKINNHLISGSALDLILFNIKPTFQPEITIGFGIFTTIFILIGLFKTKFKWQLLIYFITILIIFNSNLFYNFLYEHIIFFKPIRALSRYIFLLIPFCSILLAYFFKKIKNKFLFTILFSIFIIEQFPALDYFQWNKKEHLKRIESINLPKECKIVGIKFDNNEVNYNTITKTLDIVWYANENKKYTSNGYGAKTKNSHLGVENKCLVFDKNEF